MSAAVATKPDSKTETAKTQAPEVPAPFTPPTVTLGEPVVFYKDGQRATGNGEAAQVLGVSTSGRSATLKLYNGKYQTGVRHIDDPGLQDSEELRQNGAWEFTDMRKRADALEERVKALEQALK